MTYGLNNKKTHRVLFEVSDDRVFVHYVRHAAQDVVRPEHK